MALQVARRRFTVDEYHRLAEIGILSEDDRVELIEGSIVEMSAVGGRHAASVTETNWLLSRQLGPHLRIAVQNPVKISNYGEPEPDLAIIQARNYGQELPTPEDVLYLIEVADSSLAYDREVKLPVYARAGIAETFLVDLIHDCIERHTEPSADGYRLIRRAGRGEIIKSTTIPGIALNVDEVLGEPHSA